MSRFRNSVTAGLLVIAFSLLASPLLNTAHAADAAKLVIVKAIYGDLPDGDKSDVTAKVAAMVKDGALSVEATNDNFGDPAEGIVKSLKVEYTFEGTKKTKTVAENETLTISDKGE